MRVDALFPQIEHGARDLRRRDSVRVVRDETQQEDAVDLQVLVGEVFQIALLQLFRNVVESVLNVPLGEPKSVERNDRPDEPDQEAVRSNKRSIRVIKLQLRKRNLI